MTEREEKKLAQIVKIEKRLNKWETARNLEGFLKKEKEWLGWWLNNNPERTTQDYIDRFYDKYIEDVDCEIKHAKQELENAKATLEKIRKNEAKQRIETDILNNLPTALDEFMTKTIDAWNTYDLNLRDEIIEAKKNAQTSEERKAIAKKYQSQMMLIHNSTEDIKRSNTKAVHDLILNLYKRVKDITGDITDARGLNVTMGNSGYAVINGTVIGKEGRATIESIEAGGYNIQRWHIRTLVNAY